MSIEVHRAHDEGCFLCFGIRLFVLGVCSSVIEPLYKPG